MASTKAPHIETDLDLIMQISSFVADETRSAIPYRIFKRLNNETLIFNLSNGWCYASMFLCTAEFKHRFTHRIRSEMKPDAIPYMHTLYSVLILYIIRLKECILQYLFNQIPIDCIPACICAFKGVQANIGKECL